MRPLRQYRQDPMKVLRSRLIAAGLLVLVVVMARGVWGVYQKERDSHLIRVEAEAQLRDLEIREAALREDIAILRTDRGLEGELRERFELAKEGEGTVVIVDPPAPTPIPQEPTRLQKIKRWFFW